MLTPWSRDAHRDDQGPNRCPNRDARLHVFQARLGVEDRRPSVGAHLVTRTKVLVHAPSLSAPQPLARDGLLALTRWVVAQTSRRASVAFLRGRNHAIRERRRFPRRRLHGGCGGVGGRLEKTKRKAALFDERGTSFRITPGLFAVRLGGDTMSAVTCRVEPRFAGLDGVGAVLDPRTAPPSAVHDVPPSRASISNSWRTREGSCSDRSSGRGRSDRRWRSQLRGPPQSQSCPSRTLAMAATRWRPAHTAP